MVNKSSLRETINKVLEDHGYDDLLLADNLTEDISHDLGEDCYDDEDEDVATDD